MIQDFTENVPCPLCESTNYSVIYPASYPEGVDIEELKQIYHSSSDHQLSDQLVQCGDCSLAYLNPRIRESMIIEGYTSAVDPLFIEQNSSRISTFKKSLRYISKFCGFGSRDHPRALDVGCAGGAFPKAADDLGFNVTGIEPSAWMAEQARKNYNLDVRAGVLQDHKFNDGEFDLVTLWDVIEHLTNPDEVLEDIRNVLDDEGFLVVNYPDHASLARRILGKKWPFYLSVHLIYFTPDTITKYLKKNGFQVQEIRPYYQTLPLGYVLQRAAAYFSVFHFVHGIAKLLRIDSIPLIYNVGQSMLIAQKDRS